ncbi:Uncharacterised protein [Paenibacillus macerans]|uniref:Uncharacterized protein n=1 Tax=Paenibacillus macerans TaxID=44252 RepID=A0A090ZFV1_PAEMA|nr:hypothetical protein DJ90_386 [Paenibacillus macerans]SUD26867.1 Uncharacterised protein [Paenibacillus macerans]
MPAFLHIVGRGEGSTWNPVLYSRLPDRPSVG